MNLSSFLTRNMVTARISASTKHEAIEQIVSTVCSRKGFRNRNEILGAILSREEKHSTAIGAGVAIPMLELRT